MNSAALVHVLLEDGSEDDIDESLLVKTEGCIENENERTTWVEYRFSHSDRIVHRSVHVTMKRWPAGMGGVVNNLG